MSFLGPSEFVRNLFWQKISERLASKGEPAALGKSASGPVYYTDYDGVVHKNRVWFRSGANKEVLGVARADNQGLPDVPDLPIKVADMFGGSVVVDWQRENPAAQPASGGEHNEYSFAAADFGPAIEDTPGNIALASFGNPLYTPVWKLPEDTTNSIGTSFVALTAGTSVDVYVYWLTHLSATGNWRASTGVDAEADGERLSNYLGGSVVTADIANGASDHWEVQVLRDTHSVTVAVDDYVRIVIARAGAHANDTMTDSFSTGVNILGMKVVVS